MIRLAVRVSRERAEIVLAELLELAPSGVEERELGSEQIEYAVYGAPGELPPLPDLQALGSGELLEISTSELPDDWEERWKRFHRPVLIQPPRGSTEVPALYVRPPWEDPSYHRSGRVREIVIDPGQAFGTGAHASTRLCLELLLAVSESAPSRGRLLDVGSGSGVLAIAGALLGFAPVLALDNELASVHAAEANALVNRVEIETRRFDLRCERLPWLDDGVDPVLVLANLLRPLLIELAASLPRAPDHLIAGGLLAGEVDEVVQAFGERGLGERERHEHGDWAAVWLTRR